MRVRIWWATALFALALLIAGCGVANGGALGGTCPSPKDAGPTSAGTSVVISTDHTVYAGNGSIAVTIANKLSTNLYAWNHQTNCSILSLQVESAGKWKSVSKDVGGCSLGLASTLVKIAPGASYTVQLHAGSISRAVYAEGQYRLVLRYYTTPDASGSAVNMNSAVLTINDCGVPTVGPKKPHDTRTPTALPASTLPPQ